MSYQALPRDGASSLLKAWQSSEEDFFSLDFESFCEVKAFGTVDEEAVQAGLYDILNLANALTEGGTGKLQANFDSQAAAILHRSIELPREVLADSGFWRWATFAFEGLGADLVDLRYSKNGTRGSAPQDRYGMGKIKESMLGYLWLRGNAAYDASREDRYELQKAIEDIDFWVSHILKVDTGSCLNLTKAFAKFTIENQIPRGERKNPDAPPGYRDLAPELKRRSASVWFELMTEDEAYQFVSELWAERASWVNSRAGR